MQCDLLIRGGRAISPGTDGVPADIAIRNGKILGVLAPGSGVNAGEVKRLGLPDIDDGFLFRLCEAAAEHGGLVCPHPENIEAAWVLRDRLMAQDPVGCGGLAAWNASRPPFLEADAVQRAGLFARQTGARLYIVH